MAFDLDNFDKLSAAGLTSAHKLWSYKSSADAVATIVASAYFNNVIDYLAVDDRIYIKGSDGEEVVKVTSVTTNVTVATDTNSNATYITRFAGSATTAGGDATETVTVTGAATTDLAFAQLKTAGATPRTILTATVSATNTLTVVFSGDPSTDHVFVYQILRAV